MIWLLVIFLLAELIYFKLADKFSIVDKPNKRSSHNYITRRGGGIIFPVAWICFAAWNGMIMPWFTAGLILISIVSFMDDLKEVGVIPRLLVHLTAISFAFIEFGLFSSLPAWGILLCYVIALSAINAINFMDGINGITGMYALSFWISIAFFTHTEWFNGLMELSSPIPFMIAALIVFGIFNFRKQAICFAGDVGSVSMAYLMIGMMIFMVFAPENFAYSDSSLMRSGTINFEFNPAYLLMFAVYGIDSFLTIVHRLIRKENIFKGHRTHLYQYLVNEFGLPHLLIAVSYALVQTGINSYVLSSNISLTGALSIIISLSAIYIFMKVFILRSLSNNSEIIASKNESGFTGQMQVKGKES